MILPQTIQPKLPQRPAFHFAPQFPGKSQDIYHRFAVACMLQHIQMQQQFSIAFTDCLAMLSNQCIYHQAKGTHCPVCLHWFALWRRYRQKIWKLSVAQRGNHTRRTVRRGRIQDAANFEWLLFLCQLLKNLITPRILDHGKHIQHKLFVFASLCLVHINQQLYISGRMAQGFDQRSAHLPDGTFEHFDIKFIFRRPGNLLNHLNTAHHTHFPPWVKPFFQQWNPCLISLFEPALHHFCKLCISCPQCLHHSIFHSVIFKNLRIGDTHVTHIRIISAAAGRQGLDQRL